MARSVPRHSMVNQVRTIQGRGGQESIRFREGGLHASTGTAKDEPISAAKHRAARSGKLGKKAKAQEVFYENVLKGKGRRKRRRS